MPAKAADYDVAIVGASLAGCTAAILLGRAGARVALIEKSPGPKAFKRVCSHYVQASAVPTAERLGLYEPIVEAGGLRTRNHIWTRWGWLEPTEERHAYGLNLRRELLDPMLREMAAATPGVELMLGQRAERLLHDGNFVVGGVVVRDREGNERAVEARLTVGADGRDSQVAELAGVKEETLPHGRLAYGGYFEGPRTKFWPDGMTWLLDPDFAAAFPHRWRPDLLHRDGGQGAGARIQGGPGEGAGRSRRRHSRPAADP
jgi:2-polyprenyl-6-methoxyphenol hydroxylase-like FAD-dependent oxidoreductase